MDGQDRMIGKSFEATMDYSLASQVQMKANPKIGHTEPPITDFHLNKILRRSIHRLIAWKFHAKIPSQIANWIANK